MKEKLRSRDGVVVHSEDQMEIFAAYFEEMQWRVCFTNVVETEEDIEIIGEERPVNLGLFLADELRRAGRKLKLQKASGTDEILGELWRVILEDDTYVVFDWILKFLSSLWESS